MTKFLRFRQIKICFILLVSVFSERALALNNTEEAHGLTGSPRIGNVAPLNWPITGKVISNGEPLPGVSVRLKGTDIGATTGVDGNYTINVPENGGTLVFSFLGFISQEKTFSRASTINVSLIEDSQSLDEVLVVGYGTQTKSQVTGAISSVSAKEISELPITNAQQALQGRAAGVEVLSAGNRPGDGVNVRIRGRRSFNAGNDPLYVVDGIPLNGGINDINPQDIQSMEILKDASSTAIYGSRGANGVVIITTKKGAPGKTIIDFDSYYGISKPINLFDMMNSEQYAEYKRESRRAIGQYNDADPVNADKRLFETIELEGLAMGRNTDYQSLISQTGGIQSYQLGISGGSEKTRFSVSVNHFNDKGIQIGQDFNRDNVRVNLDQQINSKIKFGVSILTSLNKQNVGSNPWGITLRQNPLGVPYDNNGNLLFRTTSDGLLTNPLLEVQKNSMIDENRRTRIFTSLFAEYKILDGLTYRLNFGPDYSVRRFGQFQASLTNSRSSGTPFARNDYSQQFSYTVENILNYSKKFNKIHDLNFTGLFSVQKQRNEYSSIRASGLPYEYQLFYNLSSAPTIEGVDSDLSESGLLSYMGRINYGLKDKYLLTLTTRIDGSSKFSGETSLFGDTKKYGFFPSAAVAWRISEEPFMKGISAIENLKLRVSYGLTGNEGISPYGTQGSLSRTTYAFGNGSAFGYRPNSLVNSDLRWETTATTNIGLDYGLLNNRISGSLELYEQDTYDLLMPRNLPFTSGFGSVLQNVGKSRNRGIEFTVSTVNIDKGADNGFVWTTDFNVNSNREEIVEIYSGKNDDVGSLYFIGKPLTVYYDFEKLGIWQTEQAADALKFKQKPGEIRVKDQNNDGAINALDRVILGSDIPKWSGGFTNRFSYKGLDLSVFVFVRQGGMIRSSLYTEMNALAGRYNNLNVDYWTPTNPTNAFPRPNQNQESPIYSSTISYFDGSFTKIRNINLGYNVPVGFTNKLKISSLRLYASAQNPFIFSQYGDNLDPEQARGRSNNREQTNQVGVGTPSIRQFLFGLNAKF